jgi:hypothetical protein
MFIILGATLLINDVEANFTEDLGFSVLFIGKGLA